MKKLLPILLLLAACSSAPEDRPPNILLIVADDLGYTDLGCYGSEIRTPHIDELAQRGLRHRSFYAASTCSPTRAMLLTGVDNHQAGLGTMAGDWAPNQKGKRGYEAHLNFDVVTFPQLLQDAGYHTSIAGKWHLSYPITEQAQWPIKRGFTRSFCLMQGGGSHFADQLPLIEVMKKAYYISDEKTVDRLPKDFYSSRFYTDQCIDYINESQAQQKPFFSMLSFTAPHWPLQVPDSFVHLYKGKYDQGYEVLAAERLAKAKEMRVFPQKTKLPALSPNVLPWDSLNATQQAASARDMEIYAAMIERLDYHVGRVINHLKAVGAYDNTLIVFMADNGAEGNSILGYQNTREWVKTHFDNSLENRGKANSYIMQGPAWAQVSSLPFKWYKAFATEGGVRVPCITAYPPWLQQAGNWTQAIMSVKDLAPTFLALAGVVAPDSSYHNRQIIPVQGKSLIPFLKGEADRVHPEAQAHAWELFGRRGIRLGDWKATWLEEPYGESSWKLYHLREDIGESHDLADEHPAKLQELIQAWEQYVQRTGLIIPSEPTAYGSEEIWRE